MRPFTEQHVRKGSPHLLFTLLIAGALTITSVPGDARASELAVARSFLGAAGVLGFSEAIAEHAADVFRRLGSPRKRAADVAIGVTATAHDAVLVTRNARDFAGIPELRLEATGSN